MNTGDVIFVKSAKEHPTRNAVEVKFKGYGFGVLLGHLPPFAKEPPKDHVVRLMGTIGFLSFDDVGEFLGSEMGADCVKKFEDKYYGNVVNEQQELPLPPSGLVGPSGEPLDSQDPVQPENVISLAPPGGDSA